MGPQAPEQYFQNADEEKQFFQPSHQNGLQSELYFPLKKRRARGDILVLYGGPVITGRWGQTRELARRHGGNINMCGSEMNPQVQGRAEWGRLALQMA